jgi:hypothetical protein
MFECVGLEAGFDPKFVVAAVAAAVAESCAGSQGEDLEFRWFVDKILNRNSANGCSS